MIILYLYQITNLINGKLYIGQTNNIQKRWSNHRSCPNTDTAIARAIRKYGADNFKFEVLYRNVPIEEIDDLEIKTIEEKNSCIPNGYNISKGGQKHKCKGDLLRYGADNSNAHLTEEEARYILLHRNEPLYLLYPMFADKITYNQFKKVYHHQVYKNILEEVDEYPYNTEFSNQFTTKNMLEYDEVVELRKRYANREPWRKVYQEYKDRYTNEWSFYRVYHGYSYKLVMPEVFTAENKKFHNSQSKVGEKNGHAKLTNEDVIDIREKYKNGFTRQQLYSLYPRITPTTLRDIINNKTWTHLL